MWDIRQESAVALVRTSQNPVIAFDNEGLIFGIGASRTSLKLFDIRNYGAGAFTSWIFDVDASQSEWVSMEFSPDSKHVLINTNQNFLMCLDAFTGKVVILQILHVEIFLFNLSHKLIIATRTIAMSTCMGLFHLIRTLSAVVTLSNN